MSHPVTSDDTSGRVDDGQVAMINIPRVPLRGDRRGEVCRRMTQVADAFTAKWPFRSVRPGSRPVGRRSVVDWIGNVCRR